MADLIDRQAAIDALGEKPLAWTEGEYELGLQNQWQSDVDALNDLPSVQPDRSLWFRIGEICVDESKGFISSGRAVEKIRELLRESERKEEWTI